MYYALALCTTGSVRTLVRTVEEGNGAEAYRLIFRRYAPDTQNRQCALMQRIMGPTSWEKHDEGLEAGLRAWELDISEWEKASGRQLIDAVKFTAIMNQAPKAIRTTLQVGQYGNSQELRAALLQWCYAVRSFSKPNQEVGTSQNRGGPVPKDPDAMEIGALQRGPKGGGKTQGPKGDAKGGQKGGQKGQPGQDSSRPRHV